VNPVLVTGATGRVGRAVVAQLLDAGVPVRALTRRPAAAALPAAVEIVAGDLTVPDSLEAALQGAGSVFLLGPRPRAPLLPSSSASRRARGASSFSPRRTRHRTRSSSNPTPWRASTPTSSG
jgi:uncharacterized protein YbjT (DUF2867 family)